jgi:hypothetical protein
MPLSFVKKRPDADLTLFLTISAAREVFSVLLVGTVEE